jgi:hypothetical protein
VKEAIPTTAIPSPETLQATFLILLPRIEGHARVYFRHIRCTHKKADAIAETVAVSWKWFLRATQRGKDISQFVGAFASFAARAVRSGRRVCGQEKAKDALSPLAQMRKDFTVSSLPQVSSHNGSFLDEALHDNTQTPVPEQAAFRHDFPAWQRTRTERDRQLIHDLMAGERTQDVASRHGLTAGRISQLRREFHADWKSFCSEPLQTSTPACDC